VYLYHTPLGELRRSCGFGAKRMASVAEVGNSQGRFKVAVCDWRYAM